MKAAGTSDADSQPTLQHLRADASESGVMPSLYPTDPSSALVLPPKRALDMAGISDANSGPRPKRPRMD